MTLKQAERTEVPAWRHLYDRRRFGVLLVCLLILLITPAAALGLGQSGRWFDRLLSLIVFLAILSLCSERSRRLFVLLVGIPTICFALGGEVLTGDQRIWLPILAHICATLFLFGASAIIVRSVFHPRSLTLDGVLGAICGYLFLGLGWATAYSTIEELRPGSFDFGLPPNAPATLPHPQLAHLTYFSFVTLTTLGYGDVTPLTPLTQTLSWIEAISGQFYLAVIVAGLVTMLMAKSLSGEQPQS